MQCEAATIDYRLDARLSHLTDENHLNAKFNKLSNNGIVKSKARLLE
jgi:hypothetical protein